MLESAFALLAVFTYYLGFFEGDGITSQMECYFSIFFFSIVLCHIGFLCLFTCLYFVSIIIFDLKFLKNPLTETFLSYVVLFLF